MGCTPGGNGISDREPGTKVVVNFKDPFWKNPRSPFGGVGVHAYGEDAAIFQGRTGVIKDTVQSCFCNVGYYLQFEGLPEEMQVLWTMQ